MCARLFSDAARPLPQAGQTKPSGQASLKQKRRATRLVWKTRLEFAQRSCTCHWAPPRARRMWPDARLLYIIWGSLGPVKPCRAIGLFRRKWSMIRLMRRGPNAGNITKGSRTMVTIMDIAHSGQVPAFLSTTMTCLIRRSSLPNEYLYGSLPRRKSYVVKPR